MRKNKKEKNIENNKNVFISEFLDFVKDLVIIVVIVVFIRTFLFMPFQISGQSMDTSYYDKEFIIVDRFSYLEIPYIKESKVNRGDVVVFEPGVSEDKKYFIKRVIGLPGDKIKIEEGKVYLYNENKKEYIELIEGYLSDISKDSTFVSGNTKMAEYVVPENSYFMMGDNRNHSTDSRECFSRCGYETSNYINKSSITGKVLLDLGYFDWIRFGEGGISIGDFKFIQPNLGIDTTPKWFSSPRKYSYE